MIDSRYNRTRVLWDAYRSFNHAQPRLSRRWHEDGSTLMRDDSFSTMTEALSQIEGDSTVMRSRILASRADRHAPLKAFIQVWLDEEQEHARVLHEIALLTGKSWLPNLRRTEGSVLTSMRRRPGLVVARRLRATPATYCVLGAMQELVALITYRHLAERSPNTSVSRTLQSISRQESGHLRFYKEAAGVLLKESPGVRRVAQQLISRLWRPPGLDLLGPICYNDVFRPILTDQRYVRSVLQVDRLTRSMGLRDLTVMHDYLARHGLLSSMNVDRVGK